VIWTAARRWLLSLAAIVVAALAAASGLDRMSEDSPMLGRLVPGPLRAQSDRSAAAMALARQDLAGATAAATRALDADPVDPHPAALLGAARLAANDFAGADAAFRVAAQFGWREPLTQLYWFEAALDAGDLPRAAERLDALLRTNPTLPGADQLLKALALKPGGYPVLAGRLAQEPAWRDVYLSPPRDADIALLRRRAAIATLAARDGARFGCMAPRPLTWALLSHGDRRTAVQLWNAHCPERPAADDLTDGGFDQLASSDEESPFGWIRRPTGDLRIELVRRGGGPALEARNAASVSRLVASQAVGLMPGRYVVRAAIDPGGRVAASFDCGGSAHLPARVSGELAGAGQAIAVGDCPQQTLGLWLRPGAGTVTIDDVRIVRAD